MRSCLLLAAVLSASVLVRGQEPASQPTFRAGVAIVNVDVVVSSRDGQPVADLTQDDFELLEDGERQAIEQFRLVTVDGQLKPGDPEPRAIRSRADEDTELFRPDVRVFVIFLDDYHVTRINGQRVRERLIPFVKSTLGANDLVAIMTPLTPVSALTFTRGQDAVVAALRRFEGRADDFTPRNPVEEQHARYPGRIRQLRRQVSLGALQGLAVRLGSVREGRKSVLYVSEGWREVSVTKGSFLDDALTAARQNNVSLYPMDPRGLGAGVRAAPQNSTNVMWLLAEETGGRATLGRNAFEQALADMVRDSSAYYLLGYSGRAGHDGKYHEIKVRLKRRGVEVRARHGYWAMSAENALRAAMPPTPEVDRAIVETLGSIERGTQRPGYGKTWIGTSRGDGGRTRVTVVWEMSGPPDAGAPAARVSISATDAAGAPVVSGLEAEPSASPRARSLRFDAAPGSIDLRIDVDNGGTRDTERRRLRVPDFTAAAGISTPRVFRGRTARELTALRGDAAAVPLATREFLRAERLLIAFDVYGATGAGSPQATLINTRGQRLTTIPVAGASAGGTHHIELALGFLAAGDYVVEIAADETAGAATALLAFRVAG